MKSEAFFRFFERRTRRSPRMSCSATMTRLVGLEAGFQRQHGCTCLRASQLLDLGKRRDRLDVAEMVLGEDLVQAVERSLPSSRR